MNMREEKESKPKLSGILCLFLISSLECGNRLLHITGKDAEQCDKDLLNFCAIEDAEEDSSAWKEDG